MASAAVATLRCGASRKIDSRCTNSLPSKCGTTRHCCPKSTTDTQKSFHTSSNTRRTKVDMQTRCHCHCDHTSRQLYTRWTMSKKVAREAGLAAVAVDLLSPSKPSPIESPSRLFGKSSIRHSTPKVACQVTACLENPPTVWHCSSRLLQYSRSWCHKNFWPETLGERTTLDLQCPRMGQNSSRTRWLERNRERRHLPAGSSPGVK